MNVRKTASLLKKELLRRGYYQTLDQCAYYVRDVLANEGLLAFRSKDYVRVINGKPSFPSEFTIYLNSL
jgi:hypothetical protein